MENLGESSAEGRGGYKLSYADCRQGATESLIEKGLEHL